MKTGYQTQNFGLPTQNFGNTQNGYFRNVVLKPGIFYTVIVWPSFLRRIIKRFTRRSNASCLAFDTGVRWKVKENGYTDRVSFTQCIKPQFVLTGESFCAPNSEGHDFA
jgi:hypothetical protein